MAAAIARPSRHGLKEGACRQDIAAERTSGDSAVAITRRTGREPRQINQTKQTKTAERPESLLPDSHDARSGPLRFT
jgi:hypothetical protein